MRWAVSLVALAACTAGRSNGGTRDAEVSPVFNFHAWFTWDAQRTPDVISAAVDGTPVASGVSFQVSEWFPSYEAGLASYQNKAVTVTTTTGTLTVPIEIGCRTFTPTACSDCAEAAITLDEARYSVDTDFGHLLVAQYSERCEDAGGQQSGWSARERGTN